MKQKPILEVRNVSKYFPGVKALDKIHFNLNKGEVHALLGENGAGKSTFIKIITGVHQPDKGTILINGEKTVFNNSRDALKKGIIAVYQHVTCFPHLTVTENIFMGHEDVSPFLKRIMWKKMHQKAQMLLEELGASFKPNTIAGELSIAQQQMVEIAKALSTNTKVVIMDEPTASLTKRESEQLYKIVEQLRDREVGVIFISHRFEDIYRLADRVTVFRDAKYINSWDTNSIDRKELIYAMVGREVNQLYPKKNTNFGKEMLRVEHLSKVGYFKDVSFDVREGEILGITGLVGAGRTEVLQTMMGINNLNDGKLDSGKIYVNNMEVTITSPADALALGVGFLPEDKQKQGLMLDWELVYNVTLSNIDDISKHSWLNISKEIAKAKPVLEQTEVKAVSVFDKASSLSGGNQQKVVLSKLLVKNPRVFIVDEPTKGVDIGAKLAIYQIIKGLASQGYAIIMVSSEMSEILGMSHRIAVMCEGRVTRIIDNNKNVTQEMLLEASMPSHGRRERLA